MKALLKEGFDVYAIIPKGDYSDKLRREGIKVIHYYVKRGGLNFINDFRTILNLYRIFKKQRFDIIHSFTIKPNIYSAISGKLAGIPIIINHIEGLGYIYTEDNLKTKLLRFIANNLYRISFNFAKRVIFQNPDDFIELSKLVDLHRTLIIKGTGIDTNYFSSENVDSIKVKSLREELKINSDKIVITLIARLQWSKGIKEFVESAKTVMKKYNNLLFLIVGWRDEGNPDVITEDFIKESSNEFIKFIGKREEIKEILDLTDIYALPSYREGIPRTILEAMAMEKPVITTDAPGCKETVEDGVNGFLIPVKDSKALAGSIEKLILDKELRKKMGKASREKVIKEFSDEIVIEKILSLYKELLKELKT
jgi:N,N'-diacetylbacillosaminyl-diphospho-undecaprenol alpha-1,3-N-acetylgalactosaminyltransferase